MSAAARVPTSERGQCLLCGKLNHVVSVSDVEVVTWDLCKGCGLAFAELAAQVAATVPLVVGGPAAAVLEHVAGQLELDDGPELGRGGLPTAAGWVCVCGRSFHRRGGLSVHQRACAVERARSAAFTAAVQAGATEDELDEACAAAVRAARRRS